MDNVFEQAVCFLVQKRLLLRSADQPQDEVPGLSLKDIRKIEYVYVSGAAVKLWEELGKSSALFQLFLDDIWLDEETDYFEEDGDDIEHCVKYLGTLMKKERKIYNSAKNISKKTEEEYIKTFGVTPVCMQLLKGLKSSLEAISGSRYLGSPNRITTAKVTLKRVIILYEELKRWENVRKRIKNNI